MDPGETVFKGLVRLWRRMRGTSERLGPHAVRLEDHRQRFELLSALLAGSVLEIKPADDSGGVAGDALLLPKAIDAYDDPARNEAAYLYRIAHDTIVREGGWIIERDMSGKAAQVLATLLVLPGIERELRMRYPSTRELTDELFPVELARRPRADPTTTRGLLEALLQYRLGSEEPFATGPEQPDAAVADWLARARSTTVDDSPHLHEQTRSLIGDLRKLVGNHSDLPPPVPLWGQLLPAVPRSQPESPGEKPDPDAGANRKNVIELERTIRLQRESDKPREDRPLYHVFEKVETADEYGGESSTPDESGDVRQMDDALRDLSLGTAIRTTENPQNLVRTEVLMEPTSLEVGDEPIEAGQRIFHYPEWDHRKRAYRENWCTVVEQRLLPGQAGAENQAKAREILASQRRQVETIRMHLLRSLVRRQIHKRQLEGPEIDVEAMVERHADLVAGHTPPQRLYLAPRKALREIAILVVLDNSFSTDAWVEGRRVLDVEMQSLLVLSEAFSGYIEEEVAVASFRSNTRNDVRFTILKGFQDSWQHLARVAPSMAPEGYTRIGAAIRHGTTVLDRAKARKKLLLLVTDGKPTDFDRYEGRHGVEDVAKAVREASARRINTFGLAIEKQAKLHLARMLGPGAYRILPRTALLPDVMAEVFVGMLTD